MILFIQAGTAAPGLSMRRIKSGIDRVNSTSVLSGLDCELMLTAYPLNEIGCN